MSDLENRYTPTSLSEQQTAALLSNQVVPAGGKLHYLAGDDVNANYPAHTPGAGVQWQSGATPGYCSVREARDLSCPDGLAGDDWYTRRAQNQRDPMSYAPDPYRRAHSMAGGCMWACGLLLVVLVIAGALTLAV